MKNKDRWQQNLISLIILLTFIVSCEESSLSKEKEIGSKENTIKLKTSHKKEVIFDHDSAEYYITIIAIKNEVHSKNIGFGGGKSEIYTAYERLRDNLKTNDFFPLLKHDSTAVRIYAYNAIVEKDSTMSERAWKEIKGKNDLVYTLSGCTGMNETIRSIIKGYR